MRVACITGVTGQDGSYLTELLLEKHYIVYGLVRRCSLSNNLGRLSDVQNNPNFRIHYGDVTDASSIITMLTTASATSNLDVLEVYNLAAQSNVHRSFEMPSYTLQADAAGVLNILEAIRVSPIREKIRFYQASTSELFGKVRETPQTELTPFYPRSPYGVAKLYAFWITKNYREAYNMFALNGILFNHESPRRGEDFVTQKIVKAAQKIVSGEQSHLAVGNLDARRDWGHARDYVEAMWRMLQHDVADDWVVATGETHSVREFIELVFKEHGFSIEWSGEGLQEVGTDASTGIVLVRIDPAFFRPAEVDALIGDATKLRSIIGWKPATAFHELVKEMVEAERNKQN
jgi:GDPmannose 4,6-dehydratase